MQQHQAMPIRSTLRLLIARENVERAASGQPPLTQHRLALDTGLPPSVINGLVTNRTQRVDYKTLDRLCAYFNVQPGDLLTYTPEDDTDSQSAP